MAHKPYRTTAGLLKQLRHTRKDPSRPTRTLTQTSLAETLNVSNGTVSAWERGRKEPSKSNLRKLAEFYGVARSELLGDASLHD